jgi:hypothetical protein
MEEVEAKVKEMRKKMGPPKPKDDKFYWDGEDGEKVQTVADDTALPIDGKDRFIARALLNLHRRIKETEGTSESVLTALKWGILIDGILMALVFGCVVYLAVTS